MYHKIQNTFSQYFRFRGLTLYVVQMPLWIATPIHLVSGRMSSVIYDVLLLAGIFYSAKLTKEHFSTPFPPVDHRPLAVICLSFSVACFFFGTLRRPLTLSVLFGVLAGIGYCLIYYGKKSAVIRTKEPQPLVEEGIKPKKTEKQNLKESIPAHLPPTLKTMLLEGHQFLSTMEENAAQLTALRYEKRLGIKLQKVTNQARKIIKQIEFSPERIRRARTFLVIHLAELSNISRQYVVNLDQSNHDEQRKSFYQLLCESEEAFSRQYAQLASQQQEQLEIQIQVLRDQLKKGNFDD